jgi:lysyl-tRNA synthetase class 2
MSDAHRTIEEVRRAKADGWRARGFLPFGNDPGALDPIADLHEKHRDHDGATLDRDHAGLSYRVAGRIIALRDTGKLAFVKLRDGTGEVQLFCSARDMGELFPVLKDLDIGDVVLAEGRPMRTRTGELTLKADRVQFLTKALLPLPEKWHGLQDKEQRDLMLGQGNEIGGGTPQEFAALIASERPRWARVVRDAKIEPE